MAYYDTPLRHADILRHTYATITPLRHTLRHIIEIRDADALLIRFRVDIAAMPPRCRCYAADDIAATFRRLIIAHIDATITLMRQLPPALIACLYAWRVVIAFAHFRVIVFSSRFTPCIYYIDIFTLAGYAMLPVTLAVTVSPLFTTPDYAI